MAAVALIIGSLLFKRGKEFEFTLICVYLTHEYGVLPPPSLPPSSALSFLHTHIHAHSTQRLEALRAANAQEAEQLLKKQHEELRAAIDEEEKRLASLKASCASLQEQLHSLEEEKGVREATVGNLQAEEEFVRSQVAEVEREVERQRQLLQQAQSQAAEERQRRALGSGSGVTKGGYKVCTAIVSMAT